MIALYAIEVLEDASIPGFDWQGTKRGGNVFVDWMPDQPDLAVAVMNRPGSEPDDAHFGYDRARVQFIVRGAKAGQVEAVALLEGIRDALAGAHSVILEDGTIIVRAWALDSHPAFIGNDEAGRPEYDCHVEIEVTRPTTWRPLS
jgi:hypothetical protein